MKYLLLLFIAVSILNAEIIAQSKQPLIRFKNMEVKHTGNVSVFDWKTFSKVHAPLNGKRFVLLQFNKAPGQKILQQLSNAGIEIISYIPDFAYTVAVSKQIDRKVLLQAGVRSILEFEAGAKLDTRLLKKHFPAFAINKAGTIDVLVSVSKAMPINDAIFDLQQRQFELIDTKLTAYHLLTLRVKQSSVQDLAAVPYVSFVQPISPPDKILNDEVRNSSRANVLNAPVAQGGENLRGNGVVIGVGDNADITSHVDLYDRVINRAAFAFENHGTQTSGIAAGAGIKDPLYSGVAPMATIVSQLFGGIYKNASSYVADYGMAVTNNSYGAITGDCAYAGVYDLYSKVLDEQAFSLNELLQVFPAGNDGLNTCDAYAPGYHTILGGYQSAKNVLTVGWGEKTETASNNGSHGPTMDGRIKPEITAAGSEIRSPGANNGYVTDWGSSLASPAVAGGAALLIEKYRQLNGGANPKSGLVKALLMNGANDIDNAGPDYRSGFGWMNLNRSLAMVKSGSFIQGSIAAGSTSNHSINVPAGSSQLKVMLYWHDPASAVYSASTLVNDLDLEVVTAASTIVLPWKLDSSRNNVAAVATRGADHINNVEQVTINNPAAGNYIIRVKGTAINMNPSQEYFIVYDFLPANIDLTFPSVGEPLVAGETVTIQWDAWDNSSNPFKLQYSIDNGASWTLISNSIEANSRQYNWVVPVASTANAKVRLIHNGTALQDESLPFVITYQPTLTAAATQCEGYAALTWNVIPGATGYQVLMKKGPQMVPVANTTTASFTKSGLNKDSTYWFAVSPLIDGRPGRRSIALQVQPNSGNCNGAISDNDIKLDSIISPVSGRKNTSTELKGNSIIARIKNLDDAPVSNFEVKYAINGSAFTSQVVTATIPAGGTYLHTFTGTDFSQPGSYRITAVVKNSITDLVTVNDTLTTTIEHLPNDPLTLPFVENFEGASAGEVTGSRTGLPGLPHLDFQTTTPYGRVRTLVNTGIALNGRGALTIDVNRFVQTGNTNYLFGTFNLANYASGMPSDVGLTLDFWYKHHGQNPLPANRVWVRSSDTSNWIQVYNLDSAQGRPGVWKKIGPIHLSNIVGAETLSSSYQVRIGQHSVIGMADDFTNAGFTIDSVRLFLNANDFAVTKIDTPQVRSCGLNQQVPLRVSIVNYGKSATTVPISHSINNGPVVTESLPAGAGSFTFAQRTDLSAVGEHSIKVWVSNPADADRSNDTVTIVIKNQPLITSFPYLENFESGPANWYAEGYNSSWQFGTPSSIKIDKAASGLNAWKTSLQGSYNDDELSYLYSPCFDISALANPWLSLSMATDFEQCEERPCDRSWIEYSVDGVTWTKLGNYQEGLNWYNRKEQNVWDSAGFKRWHSAGIALPKHLNALRLRLVVSSDASLIKEGIAIDDIHIYDRDVEIYKGQSPGISTLQNVTGNTWQHFTSAGKVIVSLNPHNNNLGNTTVQAFLHKSAFNLVRNIFAQYYHNRNITMKPGNTTNNDSSSIRFYFTDAEMDTLSRANNCSFCSKPRDAYELGITKYNDVDDLKENGNLADNITGVYRFIETSNVTMVPYDIGYYAQFKVKDFSEFWLNNGGKNGDLPLAYMFTLLAVLKQNNDVLINWSTANDANVAQFIVEVARTNDAYSRQEFSALQTVAANASINDYSISDVEANKNGARYYRIKAVDANGRITYSEVKVILFSTAGEWKVYPNPVRDILQVVTQGESGAKIEIQLINLIGQVMYTTSKIGTGFPDKLQLNLDKQKVPAGMYILQIISGMELRQFKVIKQ